MKTTPIRTPHTALIPQDSYTYHQDPGHGWIAVNREEVLALGLAGKISSYSYQDNLFVYLEEDCDAPRWYSAHKEHFGTEPIIHEEHQDGDHWIRNLLHFAV